MGNDGCPLPQPRTTTWFNVNNHVCNAWKTKDSLRATPNHNVVMNYWNIGLAAIPWVATHGYSHLTTLWL